MVNCSEDNIASHTPLLGGLAFSADLLVINQISANLPNTNHCGSGISPQECFLAQVTVPWSLPMKPWRKWRKKRRPLIFRRGTLSKHRAVKSANSARAHQKLPANALPKTLSGGVAAPNISYRFEKNKHGAQIHPCERGRCHGIFSKYGTQLTPEKTNLLNTDVVSTCKRRESLRAE